MTIDYGYEALTFIPPEMAPCDILSLFIKRELLPTRQRTGTLYGTGLSDPITREVQ
jgi:hypothetical protein